MKKIIIVCFVALIAFFALFGDRLPKEREKTIFAMDTIITLKIKGTESQLEEMEGIIKNAEKLYSAYNENSLVYKLNKEGFIEVEDTEIFGIAKDFSKLTKGAFDMSIMPLSKLWGITSENPKVPSDEEIEKALSKVHFNNVVIEGKRVILENEAQIDLGGIVKGYVADKLIEYVKENNIKYAILDLGGNIYVLDKKELKVGIQKPFAQRGELLCTVSVNDKCVVTSGTYERNFEKDGKSYHHIFDAKTGYPTENGVSEVTIIGEKGALCDALSTALLVMGEEKAKEFYNENKDFEYILVKGNEVFVSEGIKIENLDEEYREVK